METVVILLTALVAIPIIYMWVSSGTMRRKRERRLRDWALAEGYAVIKLTPTYRIWYSTPPKPSIFTRRTRGLLGMLRGSHWVAELQDAQGGVLTVTITFRWGRMDVERW